MSQRTLIFPVLPGLFVLLAGAAAADTVGAFDTGAEGWTVVSFFDLPGNYYSIVGTYAPTYRSSGGNPGGHIFVTDPDGGDFAFAAPPAYLGNQASKYGTTISYDLVYLRPVNYQTTDVMLVADGTRLLWQSSPPLVPSSTWGKVSVPLAPSAQWRVNATDGALATAGDLQGVLGNLTGLYIRGEYSNGSDDTGLDNVQLGSVVPEPSALVLLGAAAISLLVFLFRHHRPLGASS